MRYLMPADVMKDYGIYYFDDFVRNFGNLFLFTVMPDFITTICSSGTPAAMSFLRISS